VVTSAPARLLGYALPASVITLQGVSGSVWNGKAAGCLIQVPGGFLQLGQTHWSVSPLSLLLLTPRVSVKSHWGEQLLSADVTYLGPDHLRASNVEARIDAGLLQAFMPVSLDGALVFDLKNAEIKQGVPLTLVGRVVWEDGVWLSPQGSVPLGTYAIDSDQVDEKVQATILTITGPLQADGLMTLNYVDEGARYDLALELGSEKGMNPQLEEALSLMAAPIKGGYRLALQGKLPPAT